MKFNLKDYSKKTFLSKNKESYLLIAPREKTASVRRYKLTTKKPPYWRILLTKHLPLWI